MKVVVDNVRVGLPMYDKAKDGTVVTLSKVFRAEEVGEKGHLQVFVPMYEVTSEVLHGIAEVLKYAESEGREFACLIVSDETHKVGIVAV